MQLNQLFIAVSWTITALAVSSCSSLRYDDRLQLDVISQLIKNYPENGKERKLQIYVIAESRAMNPLANYLYSYNYMSMDQEKIQDANSREDFRARYFLDIDKVRRQVAENKKKDALEWTENDFKILNVEVISEDSLKYNKSKAPNSILRPVIFISQPYMISKTLALVTYLNGYGGKGFGIMQGSSHETVLYKYENGTWKPFIYYEDGIEN